MAQRLNTQRTTSFDLNIASLSDVHLGHPKNRAPYIIENLYRAFPDDEETAKLDIISIAGDLFDKALMLNDDDVLAIDRWMIHFLRLCKKHNITLIVLRGTPSHDLDQPKRIKVLNEIIGIGADLIYVDDLSIIEIPRFGINALFVPDECRPTTAKILEDILDLMRERNLSQVDFAFMHGTFDLQVPAVARCPKHDSKTYLSLVKNIIFIGHEHTMFVHERIHAHGSFDRLSHGDEIPKGHFRVRVSPRGDYESVFVENKNARVFKTVDVSGLDTEQAMSLLQKVVAEIPLWSFVRVKAPKGHPILSSMLTVERTWNATYWSKLEIVDEEEIKELEKIDLDLDKPIEITPDNIVRMFLMRVNNQSDVIALPEVIERAELKLRELK